MNVYADEIYKIITAKELDTNNIVQFLVEDKIPEWRYKIGEILQGAKRTTEGKIILYKIQILKRLKKKGMFCHDIEKVIYNIGGWNSPILVNCFFVKTIDKSEKNDQSKATSTNGIYVTFKTTSGWSKEYLYINTGLKFDPNTEYTLYSWYMNSWGHEIKKKSIVRVTRTTEIPKNNTMQLKKIKMYGKPENKELYATNKEE